MRLRGPIIACMLVGGGLGALSDRAVGNGVIVVPVTQSYYVARTHVTLKAPTPSHGFKGLFHRHRKPEAAPVCETITTYELVTRQTTIIVPNIKFRPCFPPTPTPTPTPSAQAPPAPSAQSGHEGHDHASPSPQTANEATAGCGRCFPLCFMVKEGLRCMCCTHYTRRVKNDAEAKELVDQVNRGELPSLPGDHPYVAAAVAAATEAPDPPVPTEPPNCTTAPAPPTVPTAVPGIPSAPTPVPPPPVPSAKP